MLKEHQLKTIRSYEKTAGRFRDTVALLDNYHETYDYLLSLLHAGDSVLDLACGPGNISGYLADRMGLRITGFDLSEHMLSLARARVPTGEFRVQSIIDFSLTVPVDLVVNGFGLPYLDDGQVDSSLAASCSVLKDGGYLYLSFMNGMGEGFEITSFGGAEEFYVHYHDREQVRGKLAAAGCTLIREWTLPYTEPDGSVTDDLILLLQKCIQI